MWDLSRPGLEPVSPALAGRFSTTVLLGKPKIHIFLREGESQRVWEKPPLGQQWLLGTGRVTWNGLLVCSRGGSNCVESDCWPGDSDPARAVLWTPGSETERFLPPAVVCFPLIGKCHVKGLKSARWPQFSSHFVAKESHLVNDGAHAKWCQRS